MNADSRVKKLFLHHLQCLESVMEQVADASERAGFLLSESLLADGRILCCGNGGSAAEAQHFSSEMLNRFERERPGLPAIALTADTPTLTSIANDYDYRDVFARQILALGQATDALLAYTTSGRSPSILQAIRAAHERGMRVVLLSGRDGGEAARILRDDDIEIRVAVDSTARIQEIHLLVTHALCDTIDYTLFGEQIP